eukprot:11446637-Alexandrium_andersonii.AAC.1
MNDINTAVGYLVAVALCLRLNGTDSLLWLATVAGLREWGESKAGRGQASAIELFRIFRESCCHRARRSDASLGAPLSKMPLLWKHSGLDIPVKHRQTLGQPLGRRVRHQFEGQQDGGTMLALA